MRTKMSKEDFIKETEKRIAARKQLVEFYENVYLPMLCLKFNGKVYNIRFIKALREEAAKVSDLIYISEMKNNNTIELSIRIDRWNYTDTETLYVKCCLNEEGRMDYDASVNDVMGKTWFANFNEYTEEYQTAIDRYDEFMAVADALDSAIRVYNDLPYPFRGNVNKGYLYIH